MGTGHLMRCLALADELRNKSHKITFICRELTGNLISLIKYSVLVLPKNNSFQTNDFYLNWLGATQAQDAQQTIEVIDKNIDLLIVDSYALDEDWHQALKQYTKKIMVLDDLANRQFDCDILLNQNLGSQAEDYQSKVPDNCELLLGCNYALLRPEFTELRNQALEKRKDTKEIKNILVSLGGSDPENLTYEILQYLGSFNVIVVLGATSPHTKTIVNYAKNKSIEVIINANNMAELMLRSDLAIGAGGSTSWERCCLGLPTLLYITADNQRKIATSLEQLGVVIIVRNLKDDLQEIVNNINFWQGMSIKSKNICNGNGAINTMKLIT
jgi:UDP-2,4-diacetamido-2,4,6-trideoxy-beta-L-altropyranose hydrolase